MRGFVGWRCFEAMVMGRMRRGARRESCGGDVWEAWALWFDVFIEKFNRKIEW